MKIMLDLETLSTRSDAAIVAIGAVAFDRSSVATIPSGRFYMLINPEDAAKYGHISGATFGWWVLQSPEARAMFALPCVRLPDALSEFSAWCSTVCSGDARALEMWGNGSDFDNVVLGSAYDKLGEPRPWKYNMSRCFRTLKSHASDEWNKAMRDKHAKGTHHNALDDAVRQAEIAVELFKILPTID